jgi:hypothetical protein
MSAQVKYGSGFKRASRYNPRAKSIKAGYTRSVGYYNRFTPSMTELKFYDQPFANFPLASSAIVDNIATIPQGIGESERVGRKAIVKRIQLRILLQYEGGIVINDSAAVVRLMLVVDTQANGSTFGGGELLTSPSADDFYGFQNLVNKDRFVVLMDRVYVINCQANNGTQNVGGFVFDSIDKSVSIPIEYSGTTGVTTEIRNNTINLVSMRADTTDVNLKYSSRVRFLD